MAFFFFFIIIIITTTINLTYKNPPPPPALPTSPDRTEATTFHCSCFFNSTKFHSSWFFFLTPQASMERDEPKASRGLVQPVLHLPSNFLVFFCLINSPSSDSGASLNLACRSLYYAPCKEVTEVGFGRNIIDSAPQQPQGAADGHVCRHHPSQCHTELCKRNLT